MPEGPGVTWEKYVETLYTSHAKEHVLLSEALSLAREQVAIRLEQMNELRTQIDRERGSYITDDQLESKLATIKASIRILDDFRSQMLPLLATAATIGAVVGYTIARVLVH